MAKGFLLLHTHRGMLPHTQYTQKKNTLQFLQQGTKHVYSTYSQSGMCVNMQPGSVCQHTVRHVCTAYSWSFLGEELSVGGGSGSLFSLFLVPELESCVICIVVALLHSHLRVATESIHF